MSRSRAAVASRGQDSEQYEYSYRWDVAGKDLPQLRPATVDWSPWLSQVGQSVVEETPLAGRYMRFRGELVGGEETFVLCRSADRREKEMAIHERFVSRIEKGLAGIEKDLVRAKRRRDEGRIERRTGSLLGRNSRAAGAFTIELREDKDRAGGLRLSWSRVKEWADWAALSEGCYLLRTNLTDGTPEGLWRTYIQLTDVEEAFRAEKTELAIRPIWHQLEHRVQAHVLFSFLAYAMWKTLQTWMERSGLGRGARTVIEEFARVKAADVILPTSAGREVRLSCVTRPDAAQRAIIDRLGLELPERLGRPRWVRRPSQLEAECSLDFSRRRPQIGR